ncbi:MAG: lipocalin family protein [Pseudomonadales bacterium]|nr:lipocalin family protein [Pseudomonadales bacterium]
MRILHYPGRLVLAFLLIITSACTGLPKGVTPIQGFELNRYLGTWYEIARLDHAFERGLDWVSAEYSLRDDGGIRVVNRGYNTDKQQWKEAIGKAFFVDRTDVGRLKVSFFGPFYGGYNIIALDENYQYALIAGPNLNYLWILSRQPHLSEEIVDNLIHQAKESGFATEALIFPAHQTGGS